MRSQVTATLPVQGSLHARQQTANRRQQTHRRLSELEVAFRSGSESDLAWHITQAARSGALLAEVLGAVGLGWEMRGQPTAVLRQWVDDLVTRVFHVNGAGWPTRQAIGNRSRPGRHPCPGRRT